MVIRPLLYLPTQLFFIHFLLPAPDYPILFPLHYFYEYTASWLLSYLIFIGVDRNGEVILLDKMKLTTVQANNETDNCSSNYMPCQCSHGHSTIMSASHSRLSCVSKWANWHFVLWEFLSALMWGVPIGLLVCLEQRFYCYRSVTPLLQYWKIIWGKFKY